MGAPVIFSGKYAKLLTSQAILRSDGGLNTYDGPRNYLNNNHFELNTTGYSLFNTTLTSGLPTGAVSAGASSLNALATTSSNPLAGSNSLQMSSAGVITAGQGFITSAFTLDRKDLGKIITFQVPYEVVSGAANADFSGTSTQSIAVYVYDVTASAWVQPTGFRGINQITGSGMVSGTFQSSVTAGQQYQLAIICLNATAGALTMNFDQLYVGPQIIPIGYVGTDFAADSRITLVNTGTNTGTVYSRRVGDSLEVYGTIVTGTQTASVPSFQLAGLAIDSSKLSATGNGTNVGDWTQVSIGGAAQVSPGGSGYGGPMFYDGSTTNQVFFTNEVQSGAFLKRNANALLATGEVVSFNFRIPIAGWSSNVQLSQDTDTRVVSFNALKNAGAVTANTTIPTWTTVNKDSHGAFNASTGIYTVPVSGDYFVDFNAATTSGTPLAQILKNGSLYLTGNGSGVRTAAGILVPGCVAGDQLSVALNTSLTLTSTATDTMLSINRLSGPSVIAASETESISYVTTAASSTANNTITFIDFGTKEWDMHNLVLGAGGGNTSTVQTGWRYVVQAAGKFHVSAQVSLNGPGAVNLVAYVYQNTTVKGEIRAVGYTGGQPISLPVNRTLNCLAGDTIQIAVQQSSGGAVNLTSNVGDNFVNIDLVK